LELLGWGCTVSTQQLHGGSMTLKTLSMVVVRVIGWLVILEGIRSTLSSLLLWMMRTMVTMAIDSPPATTMTYLPLVSAVRHCVIEAAVGFLLIQNCAFFDGSSARHRRTILILTAPELLNFILNSFAANARAIGCPRDGRLFALARPCLRARAGEDAVFTSFRSVQTRSFRGRIRRGAGGWEYPLVVMAADLQFCHEQAPWHRRCRYEDVAILLLWLVLRHHAPNQL